MAAKIIAIPTPAMRISMYRRNAALLVRAIRAKRPEVTTALERRDWNIRATLAAYNYIARLQRMDC